jgi:hypothetical protein
LIQKKKKAMTAEAVKASTHRLCDLCLNVKQANKVINNFNESDKRGIGGVMQRNYNRLY